MADIRNYTPEELQEMVEKAKRDLQAKLDKMTPEERRQFEIKAQQALKEDEEKRQRLLESAKEILGRSAEKSKPKFCSNCGAPVSGGNICEFCGSKL